MHKTEITTAQLYEMWLQLPLDGKVIVLGGVLYKRYQSMSKGRKQFIVIVAALAVTLFLTFAAAALGVMSLEMRVTLWALALGLVLGGLIVYALLH